MSGKWSILSENLDMSQLPLTRIYMTAPISPAVGRYFDLRLNISFCVLMYAFESRRISRWSTCISSRGKQYLSILHIPYWRCILLPLLPCGLSENQY